MSRIPERGGLEPTDRIRKFSISVHTTLIVLPIQFVLLIDGISHSEEENDGERTKNGDNDIAAIENRAH